MTEDAKPFAKFESRGHLTQGRRYKHRYTKNDPEDNTTCPACGNGSLYRDADNHTTISYKCLKRDCKEQWVVPKYPKKN